jgi:uncharacterized membrane protein
MVLKKTNTGAGHHQDFDDRRMEVIMGRLLQVGVLLASFVMLAGGILYTRAHHAEAPNYRVFSSEPQSLRYLGGVISGIRNGDPAAIIQLAVVLLIATPVARVVFALIGFAIEKDKLYILVSFTVLLVLLFGFIRSH